MNVLGEFIQEQMTARGWKQIHLVQRSGLTKQRVSRLLSDGKLHRMIADHTVAGLAAAFEVDEQVIRLKAAEAMGGPSAAELVVVTVPRQPTDDEIMAVVLRGLHALRAAENQSDTGSAPKPRRAADDAGDLDLFSGETPTIGDPLRPGLQSRRSDADDPEAAPPRGPVSRLAG